MLLKLDPQDAILIAIDPAHDAQASQSVSEPGSVARSSTHTQGPMPPHFDTSQQMLDQQLVGSGVPRYIRPIPFETPADDLAFLASKGVFRLPEIPLRTELLRQYTAYVHPLLPVLDIREFLQAIESEDGDTRLSLLLFYAVMSAAASYADIHLLQAEGFIDRKAARKSYFHKAKVRFGNVDFPLRSHD